MVLQGQPCGRVGRCRGFEGSAKAGPSSLFRRSRATSIRKLTAMAVKQWLELVPLLRAAVEPGRDGGALDGVAVLSPAGEPV